jgi:CHAD domain-containing protein
MEFIRIAGAIEEMEVWKASSNAASFVISFESRTGPGFQGETGFAVSWRPIDQSRSATSVPGSPFETLAEAKEACNAMAAITTMGARIDFDAKVVLRKWPSRNDRDDLKRAMRERQAKRFAQEELARRTRKVIKRARKLERLDPMGRHKLRIAVKKVRYGGKFFEALNPGGLPRKARRKTGRALKDLQSALGTLNDMQVHLRLAQDLAGANAACRKAFAIGHLTGREEAGTHDLLCKAHGAANLLKKMA